MDRNWARDVVAAVLVHERAVVTVGIRVVHGERLPHRRGERSCRKVGDHIGYRHEPIGNGLLVDEPGHRRGDMLSRRPLRRLNQIPGRSTIPCVQRDLLDWDGQIRDCSELLHETVPGKTRRLLSPRGSHHPPLGLPSRSGGRTLENTCQVSSIVAAQANPTAAIRRCPVSPARSAVLLHPVEPRARTSDHATPMTGKSARRREGERA